MDNPGIKNLGDRAVTAALTDVVITEGVAASGNAQAFIDRLEGAGSVTLSVEFTYGSGGTTFIVVVQTSINQGSDWIDIARFDFAQANRHATATISAAADDVATVAALSAEGKQDGILGDRLRAKVTSTGTYAGNTAVSVRAAVRSAAAIAGDAVAGGATAANQVTGNASLTSMDGKFTTLNGLVDGLEALVGSTNTALSTIDTRVDGLESLITTLNGFVDGLEASAAAATPAGTNIIGKVGVDQTTPGTTDRVAAGNVKIVRVVPVVSASPDYGIDDVIGTKMTLSDFARNSALGGVLHSVMMISEVDIPAGVTIDVLLFNADPTNSTFTDNSALAVNVADLPFLLPAVAQLSTRVDLGTPAVLFATNLGIPCKGAAGDDLWAAAVVRGAATLNLAAVDDIEFVFSFLQD